MTVSWRLGASESEKECTDGLMPRASETFGTELCAIFLDLPVVGWNGNEGYRKKMCVTVKSGDGKEMPTIIVRKARGLRLNGSLHIMLCSPKPLEMIS